MNSIKICGVKFPLPELLKQEADANQNKLKQTVYDTMTDIGMLSQILSWINTAMHHGAYSVSFPVEQITNYIKDDRACDYVYTILKDEFSGGQNKSYMVIKDDDWLNKHRIILGWGLCEKGGIGRTYYIDETTI